MIGCANPNEVSLANLALFSFVLFGSRSLFSSLSIAFDAVAMPQSPITSKAVVKSTFWFDDGNVVLVAGSAAFKVHRGQLERHSEVFRDLFTIPQPPEQELLDGSPWVELHDAPGDVLYLLKALYDGL